MRTTDADFIKAVMTHPRIWPHVSDDGSGKAEDFAPVMDDGLYYLAPRFDDLPVGVFFYHPHSAIVFEVHTCVLPAFWGAAALMAARESLRWMVDNTPCRKVITHVPQDNARAFSFAMRVGMTPEGLNRKSFLKGGELLDQHMLGITKDEISCL